jgi:hypothetical protein
VRRVANRELANNRADTRHMKRACKQRIPVWQSRAKLVSGRGPVNLAGKADCEGRLASGCSTSPRKDNNCIIRRCIMKLTSK